MEPDNTVKCEEDEGKNTKKNQNENIYGGGGADRE